MGTDESPATVATLHCGPVIERAIQERINRNEEIAVAFIDLTSLEPFCQKYGWHKGAQLIAMLTEIIQESLATLQNPQDLLGHILADAFLVLTTPAHAEQLAKEMINRFDARVGDFYSEEDRQQGFFDTVDRRGNPVRAHLVGISIAIVTNSQRTWEHALQVELIATEIREYIKRMPGSRYAFDRRRN